MKPGSMDVGYPAILSNIYCLRATKRPAVGIHLAGILMRTVVPRMGVLSNTNRYDSP